MVSALPSNVDYVTTTSSNSQWLITFAYIATFLFVFAALAFIPAVIAHQKGWSKVAFWWFGFGAFIPAMVVVLLIRDKTRPIEEQDKTFNSADEIRKYNELMQSGAITPEEYEAKKKELLGLKQ